MRKTFIQWLPALLLLFANDLFGQDAWIQKANMGGGTRQYGAGFSIGGKGYIGTGYDANGSWKNDFWEYDTANNAWTQKADFGGIPRFGATGFSLGSKGYIGLGRSAEYHNDFWEYDPAANTWIQKADFGGSARSGATGFAIGNRGYVGTGRDITEFKNDFWEYDPTADNWARKPDLPGQPRTQATGFSIANKGYLGTGYATFPYPYDRVEILMKDFFEYDPAGNFWTMKADAGNIADQTRYAAAAFSIGNKGYIGMGRDYNGSKSDLLEYDPVTNNWTKKAGLIGGARSGAVAFGIGNKAYLGTGAVSTIFPDGSDFWEYLPAEGHIITTVSFDPIAVSTVAGNGAQGFEDGTITAAEFMGPSGVAGPDADGNIYVADQYNNRIRSISADGHVTTIAGDGIAGFADGQGSLARFCSPVALALDAAGNIYVADECNHAIRKITRNGFVTTLAGNGSAGNQNGNGSNARFYDPRGIAVDAFGNVYVADTYNNLIRKISPGGDVSSFAGTGVQGTGDGAAVDAQFSNPLNLAFDASGYLYVTQVYETIRKISPGGFVSTVNPPGFAGYKSGLAIDQAGNIYTSVTIDGTHNAIYKISVAGNAVLMAGSLKGYKDTIGADAAFSFPAGLSADTAGNIYVADAGNNRIRKMGKPALHFTTVSGAASPAQYFSISSTYLRDGVSWMYAPAGYELSPGEQGPWSPIKNIYTEELAALKFFIRLKAGIPAGSYSDSIVLTSAGAIPQKLGISGVVRDTTPPVIACVPAQVFCFSNTRQYTVPPVSASDPSYIKNIYYTVSGATIRSGEGENASGTFRPGKSIIKWTATDWWNNSSSCETPVTVNMPLSVTVPDVYPLLIWGEPNTLYRGFGPTSVTLTANAAGGTPLPGGKYSYAWSNGASGKSISVHPSVAGIYNYSVAITDSLGCQSTVTKAIKVVDVRCGPKMNRVLICWPNRHGNMESCVNENQVLLALFFGAKLGGCGNGTARSLEPSAPETGKGISLFPNPNKGSFVLQLKQLNSVEIRILDQSGRLVWRQVANGGNGVQNLVMNLGRVANGLYMVQAISKDGIYTAKMMVQQ